MDLHVVAPLPSPAERAAVDALLDPVLGPATTWSGGARAIGADGRAARGGHAARARRDLLLPALHALMDRVGWISPPGLGYVARRLTVPPAEAYGVATFYALFSTTERPAAVIHACDDIACRDAGGETLCADLERRLGPAGHPASAQLFIRLAICVTRHLDCSARRGWQEVSPCKPSFAGTSAVLTT